MIAFLTFIFVFGILVFVHEFGHFIVAKKIGAKVEEFAFGFGPKIFSTKRGETSYSINIFPLGGYVKIYGEEDDSANDPASFSSKSPLKKALVLTAGVLMNFVLAILILIFAFVIGFKPIIPDLEKLPGVVDNQKVIIEKLDPEAPAAKSGVETDTEIVSVDDTKINNIVTLQNKIYEKKGQPVAVVFRKNGVEFEKTLTPVKKDAMFVIGVTPREEGSIRAPWYFAPIDAVILTYNLSILTLEGFFGLLLGIIKSLTISENVTGPIGIAIIGGAVAKTGFGYLMQFIAMLSVTLGVINILPFPALDGGHLFILGYETLTKKKINPKAKQIAILVGFSLLILLMLVITWKDLLRFGIIGN
ncbi:MAG: Membrane-associated zinc metalloprotease [candidate division CPR2 bacterium GW2011_GWC1_41_48]|uniref:Membrane-associated zinc metalloprotease n=1 Tax=candidate division CPR2 bacterium GW2011_GWC1_41_48 TaxID=1618344 RepID=A0A0G0YJJ9_UNCC2|nr:MAG: Membrane-associated zinc metalloprotease [candidate division CPR2 bacterium GW2011_GWC2_39_35]KKR27855.1 MAG: Membrane-associated zinc metalloprotease [candidate division CPR2 bacterium GW2011_GWD2_39_7]KKS09701.1 MAG: Membrane-associated zinc metalloprotease [candidate division CPR2 bacterium GW2011_GWC1_41_48]OGB71955.1 MAG: hypothetical protein A2Y26_01520 [candidate division CPR2 bacterium GWD2_39_7]